MTPCPCGIRRAVPTEPGAEPPDVVEAMTAPEEPVHSHVSKRLWQRQRPCRNRTGDGEHANRYHEPGDAHGGQAAHAHDRRRSRPNAIASASWRHLFPVHSVELASSTFTPTWFRRAMTESRPSRRASPSAARPRSVERTFSTERRMSTMTFR